MNDFFSPCSPPPHTDDWASVPLVFVVHSKLLLWLMMIQKKGCKLKCVYVSDGGKCREAFHTHTISTVTLIIEEMCESVFVAVNCFHNDHQKKCVCVCVCVRTLPPLWFSVSLHICVGAHTHTFRYCISICVICLWLKRCQQWDNKGFNMPSHTGQHQYFNCRSGIRWPLRSYIDTAPVYDDHILGMPI